MKPIQHLDKDELKELHENVISMMGGLPKRTEIKCKGCGGSHCSYAAVVECYYKEKGERLPSTLKSYERFFLWGSLSHKEKFPNLLGSTPCMFGIDLGANERTAYCSVSANLKFLVLTGLVIRK